MYEDVLSPEARNFFAASEPSMARRLARWFERLELDPKRHNNIKRLGGDLAGYSRYRVGDWRVVYRIDERALRVLVMSIAHRGEVYE